MFSRSSKRVLPGFGLSLGSSLFYTCLILLLPLSALVVQLSSMTWEQYWQVIANPQVVAAYKVTLLAAAVASLFNAVFGMLMAWVLTRYRFLGRSLLDGLMDLLCVTYRGSGIDIGNVILCEWLVWFFAWAL